MKAKFDEDKPAIPIPEEVIDDIDNDVVLNEEELVIHEDE